MCSSKEPRNPASDRSFDPALKWAGGKRWLAPRFRELFHSLYDGRRWVEPFCGGLGLTLSLLPEKALLSDVNPHLINFYQQVAKGLRIPVDRLKNDPETYYRLRDEFNTLIKNVYRACVVKL